MSEQAEILRLQRCINDLVSLLGLPALWHGRQPMEIFGSLLDVLSRMLRLDLAYARFAFPSAAAPVELVRLRQKTDAPTARQVGHALERWLSPARQGSAAVVPSPVAGEGPLSVVQALLGIERDAGVVVVGARRADFASDVETLLLRVAVNHAALELQRARASAERARADEAQRQTGQLLAENVYLRQERESEYAPGEIVGASLGLAQVLRLVEQVAQTDACVLIQGETGTDKELVARALHRTSDRRDKPFVTLNCAAVPTGLLEAELFGHEKGAFTGAVAQRIGRFDRAHRGTLFLDEVGEIPLEVQAKLLRVLQEQEFERLGSARTIRVDVRIVAASNRDLARMVEEGRFRADLYYRLKVFPIRVPPLRDRADDIPLLVESFTERYARRFGRSIESVPAGTLEALRRYAWPGNVRELQNLVERSVILSQGSVLEVPLAELELSDVPAPPPTTLEDAEREHILRALRDASWVLSGDRGAAARLGMKRTSLQYRMKKLGITRPS